MKWKCVRKQRLVRFEWELTNRTTWGPTKTIQSHDWSRGERSVDDKTHTWGPTMTIQSHDEARCVKNPINDCLRSHERIGPGKGGPKGLGWCWVGLLSSCPCPSVRSHHSTITVGHDRDHAHADIGVGKLKYWWSWYCKDKWTPYGEK